MKGMNQRDTLLIGDQATFSFITKVPAGSNFFLQNLQRDLGNNIELVSQPKTDTLKTDSSGTELQTTFTFTSFDSGSHVIPLINGYLQNPDGSIDTVTFDAGKLEVTTIQIDTTTYRPFDIKEQMTYPYTVKEFLPWIAVAVAAVAIIFFFIRLWKRWRERRSLFAEPSIPDSPYIAALKELETIRNERLWQNNQMKLYYTRITDVLRVYIEARFALQAMEKTSAEILHELRSKEIEESEYNSLKELLEVADLVKFAKYVATETENENAIPRAIRFVSTTAIIKEE
ncbi:MAG: hypothetical protein BGO30_01105 [Bacteroidetes bacterium 41-46]|nr:MAG: hypothetical protein BGO30_01105 [Bacteroidetes bacterium 41-46]